MDIMELGAIGELVGGVAVIATLIYLALQVRQNSEALNRTNDHAQASSIQHSNNLYVNVFSHLVADAEMASIFQRAVSGDSLDEVESTRYAAFVNTFCAYAEALYHQHQVALGFSSEYGPGELLETWAPYFRKLFKAEAGNTWWATEAPQLYSRDFISAVNQVVLDAQ